MPDANGRSREAADFTTLHDLNAQLWGAAHRLANQAQDIAVVLIAKIIRHHEPAARYLELVTNEERPVGFLDAALIGQNADVLVTEGEGVGDWTGPDGSTNSVYGIVCELDSDANWTRFLVYTHLQAGLAPRTEGYALLDLQAVLDEEEAIRR